MNAVPEAVGRLEQPAPPFAPGPEWWTRLFAAIDSGDAAAFVTFLTPDARFRFGNAAVVVGAEAIRAAVGGFFAAIASSHHQLAKRWSGDASLACEGEVTYTRLDGSTVSFPFANVFELCGTKISAYRIYIDSTGLFAPEKQPHSHGDAGAAARARPNW